MRKGEEETMNAIRKSAAMAKADHMMEIGGLHIDGRAAYTGTQYINMSIEGRDRVITNNVLLLEPVLFVSMTI